MEKVSGEDVYVGGTKWTRNTVERVYFGFGPMLRAIRHCRPVVAADATFLTGAFKSTLYVIVGKCANNQLVPCAFMLAWTAERLEDWKAFLKKFKPLMPDVRVCLSDAGKGLMAAIEHVGWLHARCARHMFGNMQTKGIAASVTAEEVCRLAKLCTWEEFRDAVEAIESKNPEAAVFLREHCYEYAAWAFLPDNPRFGDALNNMAEQFNSLLVQERDGEPRIKDMGWVALIDALRRRMHEWHTTRYVSAAGIIFAVSVSNMHSRTCPPALVGAQPWSTSLTGRPPLVRRSGISRRRR